MKAGYDGAASADILGSLAAQTALDAKVTGNTRTTPSWAMSHPDPAARVVRARQRAAQLGARGGSRNGDAFLLSLKGMIYGDDPAQGVIDGQQFLYPTGRLRFAAPAGYGMSNGSDAVTVSAAAGARVGGQARFTGGRFDGNLDKLVADAFAGISGGSAPSGLTPARTTVNGMEARTATLGATSSGQSVDVTVVAIAAAPAIAYTFTVLQPRGAGLGDLAPLVNSFRRMTDAEAAAVKPRVIDVVTVGKADTVATMAARMAFTNLQTERFLVLNGLPAGTTRLTPGTRVKLVVWGAPQKY
jgi:predicted Zn-dependent protease